jgi:ABC-2 type transport system ATP-binding protein
MNGSAVELQTVQRVFGKQTVIRDVSLAIPKGCIYGFLGPSGSGKTTLVRMMVGIDRPTVGDVFVNGVKMPTLAIMQTIGYMAQSDALYGELTAAQNLAFFGRLYGLNGARLEQRMDEVLALVALTDHKNKRIQQFSGGMKRRLSLAIALLHEPNILILDEPTVGIDPLLRKQIWDQFVALRDQGTTIIVTTHVMDEAEKCDQIGMVYEGELIANDTPANLMHEAQVSSLEAVFLLKGGAAR